MMQDEAIKVKNIAEKYDFKKEALISVLQDIQAEYHYLPEDILAYVAGLLDISTAKIYGVATFYENFSLEPKGKYVIRICDGTACHVRKSIPILKRLRKELKLKDGQNTTDDALFTIETVSCLGACGLAPVITINDKVYGKVTPNSTAELLNKIRRGEE